MINYTKRLDDAIKKSAWAHEQEGQHRKGSDIPYIVHPYSVMMIASGATDDEDTLIACLMHDVLEDVDPALYSEQQMREEFGDRVADIVLDVTKDDTETDWHARSRAYLEHLEQKACDEAIIVSASDKIHNLLSTLYDYESVGNEIWNRFTTKNASDQLWWYESILTVIQRRGAPTVLVRMLEKNVSKLKSVMVVDGSIKG